MLLIVTFAYVEWAGFVEGCVEEEGDIPLSSSSTWLRLFSW